MGGQYTASRRQARPDLMRIGAFDFRPRWLPSLITLLLLPVLVSLGFWQLDRADQKRALQHGYAAGAAAPVIDLGHERPDYALARYRRVEASGQYDPRFQFLLDNQLREGRSGYEVLTPLRLAGGEAAVLVARGWLPAAPERDRLPELPIEALETHVRGVLDRGPGVGLRLGEPAEADSGWPRRLQYLDYQYLSAQLPYPVLPYLIRLDAEQPDGFLRDWRPVAEMGPEKHLGYAVQWFGLALTLVVIYVVVNLKRVGKSDER